MHEVEVAMNALQVVNDRIQKVYKREGEPLITTKEEAEEIFGLLNYAYETLEVMYKKGVRNV